MEQIFRKELMDFFHGKTLPFSVDNIVCSIVSYALCFFKPSQVIGEATWNNCISRQVTEDNWIFAKRGVVYHRRMCYTQSMEQLWTLLLLGRVWGRHAPTRSLRKCRRIEEVKSRMDRTFSRIENLWPRDGSCPLPLRSKRIFNKCFRIVKTQKTSRGCSAHVMGSPFAPNEVPAPVCAAVLSGSLTESVRSWHGITFGRLMKDSRYSMKKAGRSADTTFCFFQAQK